MSGLIPPPKRFNPKPSKFASKHYIQLNLRPMTLKGLHLWGKYTGMVQVNLGSKTHVENRCFQNGPTVGLRAEIFVFKNLTAQIKQDFRMFSYFPKSKRKAKKLKKS